MGMYGCGLQGCAFTVWLQLLLAAAAAAAVSMLHALQPIGCAGAAAGGLYAGAAVRIGLELYSRTADNLGGVGRGSNRLPGLNMLSSAQQLAVC